MHRKLFVVVAVASLSLSAVVGCSGRAKVSVVAQTPVNPPPAKEEPPPPREEPKPEVKGDEIVIPGQIAFDSAKATIKETPESLEVLNKLADLMKKQPITKLRIEGHTDSSGRPAKNAKLSKARADAVAKWLSDHEVDAKRVVAVGLGDTKPIADNATPEGRSQNRRTEFHIEELDGKPFTPGATASSGATASATKSQN